MSALKEFLARRRLRRYARASGKATAWGTDRSNKVLAMLRELPEEHHKDFTDAYMSVTFKAAGISHAMADDLFRDLTDAVHQHNKETRKDWS